MSEYPTEGKRTMMGVGFSEDDILGALPPEQRRRVTPNTLPSAELERARQLEISRRKPKAKRKTRKNRKR